jgi:hypothetical protein
MSISQETEKLRKADKIIVPEQPVKWTPPEEKRTCTSSMRMVLSCRWQEERLGLYGG